VSGSDQGDEQLPDASSPSRRWFLWCVRRLRAKFDRRNRFSGHLALWAYLLPLPGPIGAIGVRELRERLRLAMQVND